MQVAHQDQVAQAAHQGLLVPQVLLGQLVHLGLVVLPEPQVLLDRLAPVDPQVLLAQRE